MAGRGWLVAAFVAGMAVGVVGTRVTMDAPIDTPSAMNSSAENLERPMPAAGPMPANPAATINPQVARQPAVPASGASAELPSPEKSAPAVTPGEPAVAESGTVQAIDAGDVFNRIFAEAEQPGKGDSIAQAHRALERETRDDGWAYSMEAEIQNTFVNEVSMGSFRADHVECRSTMCELRLSGRGDQAAAIKRWTEELGGQPFGQRLFLNYSSSISDNNRVDTVMIFRRPPKQK